MPRKAFLSDIFSAAEKKIPGITAVVRGDDDGDVNFTFVPSFGAPIEIAILATDVAGYPSDNSFMIFTRSMETPHGVDDALEQFAAFSAGMRIPELVSAISQKLQKVLATESREDPLGINDSSETELFDEVNDDSDEDSEADSNIEYSDDGFGPFSINEESTADTKTYRLSSHTSAKANRRIRGDLRAVKFAGFKLGILSGMRAESQNSILSISKQAKRLGLSEEAMQAWDLEPQQYVVLLLKYSSGYRTFEEIISEQAKLNDITFRIGVSNKYKPTLVEALAAFTDITKSLSSDHTNAMRQDGGSIAGFTSLFISSSLNEFINGQFISLLKIRNFLGTGWDEAKQFFNDKQGKLDEDTAALGSLHNDDSKPGQNTTPDIASGDHLVENKDTPMSFPLIAVQFSLRYLIRCTEFCLVCHDRIVREFEALKPYVCDKPLCLYQYMSLGFGPSVEHEILTQPSVVDLLVSFCYASAVHRRLREYPSGMSLLVPSIGSSVTQVNRNIFQSGIGSAPITSPIENAADIASTSRDVKFDPHRREILFEHGQSSPVRNGDWVVINTTTTEVDADTSSQVFAGQSFIHCRVTDISLYPNVKLSGVAVTRNGAVNLSQLAHASQSAVPATPATTPPPPALVPATIRIYDQNFDDMDDDKKAETIVMLLQTLPSMNEVRSYLAQQGRFCEPSLTAWNERVSPAALGILRWIIASNRSCIVQVDLCPGQDDAGFAKAKARVNQKVANVASKWVQFRFTQGAPDKEQRFLNALKMEQSNLNPKYPTLFAFHGSPVYNWHSIIRQGLDFKDTLHGRAFGNGVYHAQDQNSSVSYSSQNSSPWPGSELNIQLAMSLNEIVNCPQKYQSVNPHLVVQNIDWIQCRYLLVQTQYENVNEVETSEASRASDEVAQDPKYTARSTLKLPIGVPECATSVSRAFRVTSISDSPVKKKRKNVLSFNKLSVEEGTVASDFEEMGDLAFLLSDDEEELVGKGKAKSEDAHVVLSSPPQFSNPPTDFVPGSLDQESLPLLNPPSYATHSATLRLNRELKTVLNIQASTPLHELGWYIDSNLVNNVYQWIVELHSFDSTLPLAKDMKSAGVTSVVLEIRFGKDFPHSPPFVRVIRPRFLPFIAGGGGHVTGGGAMCMELLTNSGWSAVSSIESVLLQVRMAIMNLEPKPARLESNGKAQQRDYGTGEAMDAFIRACRAHGWQVPTDFNDFAGDASTRTF